MSAALGQYYAHPQNRFWPTLYAVGLTPRLYRPGEFALLPALGIGLTDIAKEASGMDHQLPAGALGPAAVADLRSRIERAKPKLLAFTSLTGGRLFEVSKKETIEKIYADIQEELRNQYRIGYTPAKNLEAGYHKIHLATNNKDLKVQARDGYYSSSQSSPSASR